MIPSNIETLRAGKVLPDHCACGHLKDNHLPVSITHKLGDGLSYQEEVLQCQCQVFDTVANKMLQCGCKI